MTTNTFISESGQDVEMLGSYNHSEARMWFPEENNLTIAPTIVGEVRYVGSSGVLVIWNGESWATYLLTVPSSTDTGNSPIQLATDELHFWGEASGMNPVDTSGSDIWYSSFANGVLYDGLGGSANPTIADADSNGLDALQFRVSGSQGMIANDGDTDFNGTEDPVTLMVVVKNNNSAAGIIWGAGRNTSDFDEQFIFYHNVETITALNRDVNTQSVTAGSHKESDGYQLLTFVGSGQTLSIYQSGVKTLDAAEWGSGNTNLVNQLSFGYWARLNPDSHADCTIAEAVVWSSGLHDVDRIQVERYLDVKHNLGLGL